jgi:uncharacterized protein (DUF1778 family)
MTDLIKYRDRLSEPRSERLYLRVSAEEKRRIQDAAQAAGYQSVGAYLVDQALLGANQSTHTA